MPDSPNLIENPIQRAFDVQQKTAERVSPEEYAKIYGRPWWLDTPRETLDRERRDREVQAAFEAAVHALIEQGRDPTPAALAEALGAAEPECVEWLETFTKYRISNQEKSARDWQQRGLEAQRKVIDATRRLEAAEAALRNSRFAKGLPAPDLDDKSVSDADPYVRAARQAKADYAAVKAQYGYMDELSRNPFAFRTMTQNQDNRRDRVAAAVAQIRDAMRNHDLTLEQTQKFVRQLAQVQNQIAESRQREQATHALIIRQHVEFWRLTGELMVDYKIPPKPGVEADTSTS